MDEFCGSPLWDLNQTWYTEDPDVSPCFEKTVLIWIPCIFLWVCTPLEIYYLSKSRCKNIPWNFLNISKLVLSCLLVITSIVDLVYAIYKSNNGIAVYTVDFFTPALKLLTFALAVILLYFNRLQGMQTSGLLWQFYFFLTILGIAQLRTEMRVLNGSADSDSSNFNYYSYIFYYTDVCLMFVLNCFSDAQPAHSEYKKTEKLYPEIGASFLSRLLFAWFDPMAWKGYRHPLEVKDLWDLNPEHTCKEASQDFIRNWEKSAKKAVEKSLRDERSGKSSRKKEGKKRHQASIFPILCKTFGPAFLFGGLIKLMNDLLTFISPQILKLLIEFIKSRDYTWKGYLYAVAMLILAAGQTILLGQYFNRMFLVGIHIRTSLITAIYQKALRMSNAARKESTVGEIVNLMSVDAQRFMDLTTYLNMLWSAPLQMILALYFLWSALGISVFGGLAVMVLMIPINGLIANKARSLQIQQMKFKDERVKLMNEVLSGMKVLKLYAWEPSFEDQILRIRKKEMRVLKIMAHLNAATSFLWFCAPFLVSLASFAMYVVIDENNVLDAETAFYALSLFNLLRFPLAMLPMMITSLIQAGVSVKRINKFLNCKELDPNDVSHDPKEADPVVIENGTFSWGDDPILKNINLHVKKGGLVAVVGTVGTGKSSLLAAILGEMEKISGRVNTSGRIAYVPQQAWIRNATLRDNILFGGTDGMAQYYKIVEACALKSDFEMLPAGDQTEIGEKGINLSGGQKQRVSLARAVFSDADIYLLDDPLSAVDSHVGKHIFEHVIGPQGVLQKKTRLLVTHSITYLPEVDHIIVLKNGEISECGTFKELLTRKGAFAEFLLQHLQEVDVGDTDTDLEEIKAQLEDSLGGGAEVVRRELQRQISRLSEQGLEGTPSHPQRRPSASSGKLSTGSNENVSSAEKRTTSEANEGATSPKVGEKLIDQEKVETGSVKKVVFLHYAKSIGIFATTATIVLNIIFQAFAVGSSMWLSVWSNDDTKPGSEDFGARRDMYLGIYGALGIAQVFAVWLSSLSNYLGALHAAQILHNLMLKNVMRTPVSFFDVTPIGRLLNRFSKDVDVLDNILPMSLRGWTNCLFSVVGTLAVISYSTPIFIAVIVPLALFYYFVQRFYVATSRQLKRLDSVSQSPIYSHFSESITGATSIRAYGLVNQFIKESEDKVDFNQTCNFPMMISNRWAAIRLEMVGNFIIFFAALFAVIDRESNAGLVGLSVSYALQVTQNLNFLVRLTSEVETNIVAVERIKEYSETPQEAPWNISSDNVPSTWPEKGEVEFVDYKVRYREGLDLVLKGVKFVVKGGEKVGIVGRTGAGKSSLTLGLFRIIEAADGQILIDGVDISKLGLHELRGHLTIIPQDPVLFSGSLRLNLDPFGKYSDAELWKALEHAHLKAFVKELTEGLEYGVSEGGENLSVGQRQLICLARALLRKTRVLVLDEATAAVDLETDDLIQTTIRQEFKDCTVLTIAHRLNTVMDSDRVLVLDQGNVVEYDSPQNLLAQKNSIFLAMARDAGIV